MVCGVTTVVPRGGWCHTCPANVSSQDCPEWGWCAPGCDGDLDLPMDHSNFTGHIHELPVDSFVYENCSLNVDTLTEFCTGRLNILPVRPSTGLSRSQQ